MKRYAPRIMQPNTNQFYSFIKDKLSEQGMQSPAGLAVRHLFQTAQSLYNSLETHAGKNLTSTQEQDLVALTAKYVIELKTFEIQEIVNRDMSISEEDRFVLKSALELYINTAHTTTVILGMPRWAE
jgi:hypothetical protein